MAHSSSYSVGLKISAPSALNLTNCTFINNYVGLSVASLSGPGYIIGNTFVQSPIQMSLWFTPCFISQNIITQSNGLCALSINGQGATQPLTITNNTITGNSYTGYIVYVYDSWPNPVVSFNSIYHSQYHSLCRYIWEYRRCCIC